MFKKLLTCLPALFYREEFFYMLKSKGRNEVRMPASGPSHFCFEGTVATSGDGDGGTAWCGHPCPQRDLMLRPH